MSENKDTSCNKNHIEENPNLSDIDAYLKNFAEYSWLDLESKVIACTKVYNDYLEVNTNSGSLKRYLLINGNFIYKAIMETMAMADKNWDAKFALNNYYGIGSMLISNSETYYKLCDPLKTVAMIAIYNCYCKTLVDEDMLRCEMIETYINNNKDKVENILKSLLRIS